MSKAELGKQKDNQRDLQNRIQDHQKRESSSKFKFNRQYAIKKRNTDLQEKYVYGDKIGEGSFGEVYKIVHRQLNLTRALKVIKKNTHPLSSHNPYEQLEILKKLDHPNVLKVYEYFETDTQWLIITEYFQGKQLFDQIIAQKKLTQRKAALIFAEVCKAIAYIHAHSIVHRDIKPENILVKKHLLRRVKPRVEGQNLREQDQYEYEIKLIDWGLGSLQSKQMIRKCGTPQYCAPQVLQGSYGYECDLWSLGVLLYVMLVGRFPFKGQNVHDTLHLVARGVLTFKSKQWEEISIEAKYLISCLIRKSPQSRLKAAEVLKSQWIIYHIEKSKSFQSSQQIFIDQKLLQQTLIRLKQVTIDNKFQAVVINFIHNYITSAENQRNLKKQFEYLDENKDGVLSYQELLKGYESIYPHLSKFKVEDIVMQIFKNMDLDGSNQIEYSQFVTFATKISHKFSQKQLAQVFKLLDDDNNGSISKKQINQILLYEKGSQSKQFDQIVDQMDLDEDGSITMEQFIKSINKAINRVVKKNRKNQSRSQTKSKQKQRDESKDHKSDMKKKQKQKSRSKQRNNSKQKRQQQKKVKEKKEDKRNNSKNKQGQEKKQNSKNSKQNKSIQKYQQNQKVNEKKQYQTAKQIQDRRVTRRSLKQQQQEKNRKKVDKNIAQTQTKSDLTKQENQNKQSKQHEKIQLVNVHHQHKDKTVNQKVSRQKQDKKAKSKSHKSKSRPKKDQKKTDEENKENSMK